MGLGITVFLFPETLKGVESKSDKEPLMDSFGEDDDGEVAVNSTESSLSDRLKTKLKTSWVQFNEIVSGVGASDLLLLQTTSLFCTNTTIKSMKTLGLVQSSSCQNRLDIL